MSERKHNGLVVCQNSATDVEKRRHSLWQDLAWLGRESEVIALLRIFSNKNSSSAKDRFTH